MPRLGESGSGSMHGWAAGNIVYTATSSNSALLKLTVVRGGYAGMRKGMRKREEEEEKDATLSC